MSNFLPDRVQRTIIRSFARTVRDSSANFGFTLYSFLQTAVNTDLFLTFEDDFTLHSQSPNCIVREFIKYSKQSIQTIPDEDRQIDAIAGYWMGFVIMQYAIRDHFPIKSIRSINMEWLYDAYDVLHTTDVNYTIDYMLRENYHYDEI